MKVLLTGATGFIGSHVARTLLRENHEVHTVIRPQSNTSRIDDILSQLHIITGDLLSPSFIPSSAAFDCCIHFAWFVDPGAYLHAAENRDWIQASLQLAQSVRCGRFISAGTCFEYALTGAPLTESSLTEPRTPYAKAKLDLFHALQSLDRPTAWVRFFYQYGPGEDSRRLVPVVINSLLQGKEAKLVPGDRVRDYLSIEDVAAAVCAVAASELTGPVNIGSGERTTVRKIAQTIGELLERPELLKFGAIPYRPDEPLDILADNAKLRSTSWKQQIDLTDGLRATIEWWRQARPQN